MRNAFLYTYNNGLQSEPVVVSDLRNIGQILGVAHGKGLDETSAQVQDVISAYVNYPPYMDEVHMWVLADAATKSAMETNSPWLTHYRGEAVSPPADDPAVRQAEADAVVAGFYRRVFKNERAQSVRGIDVSVNGKSLDGDEVSQTRMTRVVTVTQQQLLNGIIDYLDSQSHNASLTVPGLVSGLLTELNTIRAGQDKQWMLADNTAATLTPDELTEGLYQSLLLQEHYWGFSE